MTRLKQLIQEIHRRSLWQVLGIYAVSAWIVFEVTQTLTEGLQLPPWVPPLALVLLLIGLPIVIATAFVQEGIAPSPRAAASDSDTTEDPHQAPPPPDAGVDGVETGGLQRLFTWRNALAGGLGAFAMLGLVAAGWLLLYGPPIPTADAPEGRTRVAVLPFQNLSADTTVEYFSDGITDDIITQLSKIGDLTVISRTSVMQYKDTRKTIPEIGQELGVSVVLEGGVRRDRNRVRINAQLIDTQTDEHLWADTYDRDLSDVFAIQSDVALRIANALDATLSNSERERIEHPPTQQTQAYELYLRARQLWYSRTSLDQAIDYFARAIELDPAYAQAYSGLAATYVLLPNYGFGSPAESYPQTLSAARRALALDSTLAEPYAALALATYIYEWNWDEADRLYRRAVELEPSYANGHYWYAYQLLRRGRLEEGFAEARIALELDPLSPAMAAGIAGRMYSVGRFEEAEERLREILRTFPNVPGANVWLGTTLLATGRAEEGLAAMERAVSLSPAAMSVQTMLAAGYARAGRREDARTLLARLESEDVFRRASPTWIATTYAQLGEPDRAFEWLDRAAEERDDWLMNIGSEPLLDPLRADPRMDELLRRIGLRP